MRTADFDYVLPSERIAQQPLPERHGARLMVLPRAPEEPPQHRRVVDLPALLPPETLLVVNDTKVFPARLRGRKPTGGRVELLLLEPDPTVTPDGWLCLYASSKRPRRGTQILFQADGALAEVERLHDDGRVTCAFHVPGGLERALDDLGEVPLPPYIQRPHGEEPHDRQRYQTVYAAHTGAVAAPTAGLHFSRELLAELGRAGIETASVTLHVGPGTFTPVRTENLSDHQMHSEQYDVSPATAAAVTTARQARRPVVAVGTTVVRALESVADEEGRVTPMRGRTSLFITPGYRWRAIDGLITNFHLPRSTLIMLVAALCGRQRLLAAYAEAIREGYRFYSYGDAMLVMP